MKVLRNFMAICFAAFSLLPAYAGNIMIIREDEGGSFGEYVKQAIKYQEEGTRIIFDGVCTSSCTIYTMSTFEIERCMTKRAMFGYHQPYYENKTPENYKKAAEASKAMWNSYHPIIKRFLSENGWPSHMKGHDITDLAWMDAEDMEGVLPYCE